jgi:hypothetical protein
MKIITTLFFLLSLNAFACQENFQQKFQAQFPNSNVTVNTITNVDEFLVDTCNEELQANQSEKPENRLACNLLKADRPEGLIWYSVRLENNFTDLKKLIGATENCKVIYSKNVFHH